MELAANSYCVNMEFGMGKGKKGCYAKKIGGVILKDLKQIKLDIL